MIEVEKDRTHSIWEDGLELAHYPKLQGSINTEICIVGGGLAGISTAYQLAKRGFKVALLESSRIASGQSGRTTAHLTYQVEEQLCVLLKHHRQKTLEVFVQSHKLAIDVIEEIINQENISCDFKRLNGYLFTGPEDTEKTMKEEVRLGNEMGLDLSYVENIPQFHHLGPAVLYPNQAQFHPLKYMSGLLRVMKELDVSIYENSHVKDFKRAGKDHLVVCEDGSTVTAKHLVVATDSPVNNRFYIHSKQAAYRTYVVGFSLKHQVDIPLLWDTKDPYHYIRQCGDTVIIGGEDHRTGQQPSNDPYEELIKWGRDNFAFLGEVKWQWSGQVFEPVDGIAYIGRNPGLEKNVYVVTGQSGIGMTNATIASQIITDLIEGRANPMIDVFDPSRSPLRDTPEFIKDNTNIAFQYKDWITSSEVKSKEEIPEDQGSLMREGLTKSCVYHGEGGEFEKKSAVCPHLGGIVRWNDLEKTWDCPCHGSRFNTHGKVIEGPSLNDLVER